MLGKIAEKQIEQKITRNDDFDFLSAIDELEKDGKDYFYWNEPEKGFSFLGFGEAFSAKGNGSDWVKQTNMAINKLKSSLNNGIGGKTDFPVPLIIGGLKFSPDSFSEPWENFSDSDWFVPQVLFVKNKKKTFWILNLSEEKFDTAEIKNFIKRHKIHPKPERKIRITSSNLGSEEEKSRWISLVNKALEHIKKNEFKKIVLSREVYLKLDKEPATNHLINLLSERYPRCYVYAFRRGNSVFFGASPEKLARFSGGYIEADALAGSIPRGRNDSEDKILESELLKSPKNLNEQQAVVDFIVNSFKRFASDIEYDENPTVRKLPNIQHLWTPIRGKLNNGKVPFEIIDEVHPTPAICGAPWTDAMSSILKMEKHKRGLYTGVIGWFNFEGEGEFAVGIRSALKKGKTILAYAGCGIVEGSDPESEFEETKLKLKPILNLFLNDD